jgi:NAD(P)-dependent dehydrogenase (short-subunit alcohol dehydrogenase family)
MHLQDKSIIVTGSTTGIGKAIARRCVEEGARVLVHGRDESRGRKLVEELGGRAALHVDDLADPDAGPRLVEAALQVFGKLDAIVNNAAYVKRSDIHSTDAKLFDQVMAVNCRAPFLLIKAALPHLQQARGCALNIGSVNAYVGEAMLLAYAVSKGALATLSRNLGDWLHRSHGVRINHFNVGWTLTENEYDYKIADGLPPDWPDKIPTDILPTGRLMRPEMIAAHAVFWLSDASRPISGQVIELEQFPVAGHIPTMKMPECK